MLISSLMAITNELVDIFCAFIMKKWKRQRLIKSYFSMRRVFYTEYLSHIFMIVNSLQIFVYIEKCN